MMRLAILLFALLPVSEETAAQALFAVTAGGQRSQEALGVVPSGSSFKVAVRAYDPATGHRGELWNFTAQGSLLGTEVLPLPGRFFPQAMEPLAGGGAVVVGAVMAPDSSALDAVVMRLNASYAWQWSTVAPLSGGQVLHAATVLPDGSVIATGTTSGPERHDVLVVRVSSTGALQWTTVIPGALDEEGLGVAVDATGAVITGRQMNYGGSTDCYFARVDLNGGLQWVTAWGGVRDEVGLAITRVAAGHFVMAGWTQSHAAYDQSEARWPRATYLLAIDANGDTLWTRSLADTLVERTARSIGLAPNGDLFVGITERPMDGQGDGAAIMRATVTGSPLWTRSYDLGKQEEALQVRPLANGAIACGRSFGAAAQQVLLLRTDAQGN
jgi:hypothetical protein